MKSATVRWGLALLLAGISLSVLAQAGPQGENCQLQTPPPGAGETYHFVRGTPYTMKVFPRLSAITATYSGCQVAWIDIGQGEKVLRIEMRQGQAVALWPAGIPGVMCEKGESSVDTGCMYPAHSLGASAFPGCIARAQQQHRMPQDCLQELFRERDLQQEFIDRAQKENAR